MASAIEFAWLRVGGCRNLECAAMRGGRLRTMDFPCHVGMLRHPDLGVVLFDTGYSAAFVAATRPFPERLYALATPVHLPDDETLIAQLAARGVAPSEVAHVLLSHLHADHVAGLAQFPHARVTLMRRELEHVTRLSRWNALRHAYLHALLPGESTRMAFVEDRPVVDLPRWMAPFTTGFDLAGDGSLVAVPLPGHSVGQFGLLFATGDDRHRFLIADACWSGEALVAARPPARLAMLLFHDRVIYLDTFAKLRSLALRETHLLVLPSHCAASARRHADAH
jgi:glyoxylase-like metal-dependent hydrolase (beta-lactamase superfamily II)